MTEMKKGRGRCYALHLEPELYGAMAPLHAKLVEQTDRLRDLIAEMPDDAGNFVPEWGENSIFWLSWHMARAEANWVARVVGGDGCETHTPEAPLTYAAILAELDACRTSSAATLAALHAGTATFSPAGPFTDLEMMLEHLVWHWIYHSGQVGLMRRLVGQRYRWTFA